MTQVQIGIRMPTKDYQDMLSTLYFMQSKNNNNDIKKIKRIILKENYNIELPTLAERIYKMIDNNIISFGKKWTDIVYKGEKDDLAERFLLEYFVQKCSKYDFIVFDEFGIYKDYQSETIPKFKIVGENIFV